MYVEIKRERERERHREREREIMLRHLRRPVHDALGDRGVVEAEELTVDL